MRIFAIFLLWVLAGQAVAQEVIRSDAFLERMAQDPTSPSDDYSDRRRVRLPWIEAYEYRTETDEFDPERQEHALRLSPSSPGLQKARSRLAEHYRSKRSVVEAFYRNDRIERAYQAWKDVYVREQKLTIYTRLQAILTDRLTVRQKELASLDTDIDDVLDMRAKLNDLRIRRLELERTTESLRRDLGLENTTTEFEDMVTLDQILLRLTTDSITSRHPMLAEYHYERELIDREMALERAEKRQFLDFVQVRYNGPHDNPWEERVQLRAGFVLPTSGGRNLKLEELRLEQEELAREQQVKGQELNRRIATRRQAIRDYIAVYRTFEEIKGEEISQLQQATEAAARRRGSNPDLLLKIKEKTEETRLEKLERQEEIYDEYLEYLSLTGQLFDDLSENYLTN